MTGKQRNKRIVGKYELPVNKDADGYIDRQCPSGSCEFPFKVFAEDWKGMSMKDIVFCPFCGISGKADEFITPEQSRNAEAQVSEWKERIKTQPRSEHLKSGVFGFPIDIHFEPIPALDEMRLKITLSLIHI